MKERKKRRWKESGRKKERKKSENLDCARKERRQRTDAETEIKTETERPR